MDVFRDVDEQGRPNAPRAVFHVNSIHVFESKLTISPGFSSAAVLSGDLCVTRLFWNPPKACWAVYNVDGMRAASVVRVRAIREGVDVQFKTGRSPTECRQRLQYAKRRRTHRCYCSPSNLRFEKKNSVFKGSEVPPSQAKLRNRNYAEGQKSRPRFVSRHSNVFRLPMFDRVIRFFINR